MTIGLGLYGALLASVLFVVAFFLPPPMTAVLIITSVLTSVSMAWVLRPVRTLITTDGVFAASGSATWDEIVSWEIYNEGRSLTISTRSHLLRVDELSFEVPIYANSETAAVILQHRIPNGRVLP